MTSTVFIPVFLIVTLQIISFTAAESSQFHHKLSQRDLRRIFHVDSPEEVPKYDIIELRSRMKRSADGVQTRSVNLKAFGEERVLNLTPNEGLVRNVPVFFADPHATETGGVVLTPAPQNDDIGVPYQDEATRTAVVIKHHPDTGALLMDGTIGEDFVVRSVPPSLHSFVPPNDLNTRGRGREDEASENDLLEDDDEQGNHFEDDLVFSDGLPLVADDEFVTGSSVLPPKERKMGKQSEQNLTKEALPEGLLLLRKRRSHSQGLHVVYRREVPLTDTDYAMMELDQVPLRSPEARSRSKREAPYVIYPEILVLVDYDGYLLHGQDNSQIKSYYVSFWNGVDLRYKLLKGPKVKISIAGIIISRSKDAMPYLERNQVGRDAIDSAAALTDMGKYLYQERRLPTYDIAVAITKLDMCRRTTEGGNCNRGTAGFAYVGGACVVNKRLEKVNSVAIVEDTGGFSGIIVAAHEVGHLLGAVHDGSPPPSYLGGPGARRCRWKDGYIMSDLRHTERGFMWSPCSIEQFHHFLNGETATCLYNLPHEDESLPRILPGKLLSLDAQCRKDRGTSACFKDDRVCAQLFCFDSSSGFCVSYRPAAEGSPCGSGKICLNGKCAYDNENSISDLDIHRPDDNFIHDSINSNTVVAHESSTGSSTTYLPVTTTTTSTKPFTTKRSDWWQNNNRWNNNKQSSTTTHTTQSFPTTIQLTTTTTTTKRTTPITKRTTKRATPSTTTTTTKRTTTTPTTTTTTTKRTTPTTSTTKRTTPTTTRTTTTKRTTTTTTTEKPTDHSSINDSKDPKKLNGININDSNSCQDTLPNVAGNLSCKDFLKNYGFRYCNHRYIEKNCCRSKKEMCSEH